MKIANEASTRSGANDGVVHQRASGVGVQRGAKGVIQRGANGLMLKMVYTREFDYFTYLYNIGINNPKNSDRLRPQFNWCPFQSSSDQSGKKAGKANDQAEAEGAIDQKASRILTNQRAD